MSQFCGICHFDSRPLSHVDEDLVDAMLDAPGYAGPLKFRGPGLVLGCAAGANASRHPVLFESSAGKVCLWDGRLDNRRDLLRATGLPEDSPESAISLDVYQREGVDGLGGLVGDWSLCIWDAARREIVLASDYAGIRPLYYHRRGQSFYWSTSLAALSQWTGITELDETYIANFLVRGHASVETPYAGIFAVPSGHAVSISRDRLVTRAHWSLPLHREIRYSDEREYEEQMLELFGQAVQVRIGSSGLVCAELSGGLDSSSVVCMADRLRREPAGPVFDLATFSYTHENCPDEKYFREVERACGLTGCHLELPECPAIASDVAGAAPTWWEPRFRELSRRMASKGSSVLLTGQLGDFIMGNASDDTSQVTESLAGGHFVQAARDAYGWARSMQVPLYPILWRSIRETCGSWVPPVSPHAAVGAIPIKTEDSLANGLRVRLAEYERERAASEPWRHARPGRRRRFRGVGEMLRGRTLQTPSALQHISYSHPYAHRPLVEFMLSIPGRLVCGPDQPRRLMRRAFAGLLPPMVVARKSKAAYTSVYLQSLMPLATALLNSSREIQLVERGYVNRQSLTGRLERFTQGLECNESQLRPLVLLEFWLRNQPAFGGSQASSVPPPELALS